MAIRIVTILLVAVTAGAGCLLAPLSSLAGDLVLLSEDFESLALGPAVNENLGSVPVPCTETAQFEFGCWSPTGPAGWTVNNSAMPGGGDPMVGGGVREWYGWTWADPVWWDSIAGQNRANFTFGTGFVTLIADSDEWDDDPHVAGPFDSKISSPSIAIGAIPTAGGTLRFDSSWRPELGQTAYVDAVFNGDVTPTRILTWDSDPMSPNFHGPDDGSTNPEVVSLALSKPAGKTGVTFTFGYTGTNNWWWAIDNLQVLNGATPVHSQNWESVTLGDNVDEGLFDEVPGGVDPDHFWTETPPAGWTLDDSGVPGIGDDATDGVTEWAGWSFAEKNLWSLIADDQNRSFFTKAQGTVMVADPDEWDDAAHPPFPNDPATEGWYDAIVHSPEIPLTGVDENSIQIKFDSSWRDEGADDGDATNDQTAVIRVSFDGGAPVEVMRWESVPSEGNPFFHDDNENETVMVSVDNPAGAESMVVTFGLLESGNDWWWAIDNLEITGGSGGAPILGDLDCDGDVDFDDIDDFVLGLNNPAAYEDLYGVPPSLKGDTDNDDDLDFDDITGFVTILQGGLQAVPEPTSMALVLAGSLGLLLWRRAV